MNIIMYVLLHIQCHTYNVLLYVLAHAYQLVIVYTLTNVEFLIECLSLINPQHLAWAAQGVIIILYYTYFHINIIIYT